MPVSTFGPRICVKVTFEDSAMMIEFGNKTSGPFKYSTMEVTWRRTSGRW
jgi:hypothetical protein